MAVNTVKACALSADSLGFCASFSHNWLTQHLNFVLSLFDMPELSTATGKAIIVLVKFCCMESALLLLDKGKFFAITDILLWLIIFKCGLLGTQQTDCMHDIAALMSLQEYAKIKVERCIKQ